MATVLAYRAAEADDFTESWMPGLSDLVEVIGLEEFGNQMLAFLDRVVGADHCTIYQLSNYDLVEVGSAGIDTIPEAYLSSYEVKRRFRQLGTSGSRVDTYRLSSALDCSIRPAAHEGIMVLGSKLGSPYCIRILRTSQGHEATEAQLGRLREAADVLISLAARHQNLFLSKPTSSSALTSLVQIQERILSTKSLSRREGEVCARILYGFSSCGIALDLGIGKESVMTYRKRAYQHLGIGSQRELLLWYLEQVPETLNS